MQKQWIGERKSAKSCLFLAKSVNPPLFSFKSESALFGNFPWHIFTATDGICCFFYANVLRRFVLLPAFATIPPTYRGRPTKMNRTSFSIHDQSFLTRRVKITEITGQNSQLIRDPRYFRNPWICSIYRKKIRTPGVFLRPNPSIPEPIHPFVKYVIYMWNLTFVLQSRTVAVH